jgi:phosphoglycolate phosphatase-like HAD superfamily hydrolase
MPASRFLPGTTVEIIREVRLAEPPRFAVFDFDGTLSLIREGWSDIMLEMMVPALGQTGSGESEEELTELCRHFLAELTGKPSIYQMARFCEELTARGGVAESPETYLARFRSELMRRVGSRRDELRGRVAAADAWLVPHAVEALNCLQERGIGLVLASGTDEQDVRLEAELLGLREFFGDEIYGARPDVANSTRNG